jgi:hypothetical protein
MRRTPTEQQVIRDASLRYLGVRPRLFGNRLHRVADIQIAMRLPCLKLEFEQRKTT